MEIRYYFSVAQRWAWLLVLGLILGASGGYVFSLYEVPTYRTSARVQVMSAPASGRSDTSSYWSDMQLAQTYAQTLRSRPIVDMVSGRLGVSVSPGQIETRLVPNTQLIDVFITDTDPNRAAEIANALVSVFAEKNAQQQADRFAEAEASLLGKIQDVDVQVQALQNRSTAVSSAASQETLKKTQDEIARLEKEILEIQQQLNIVRYPTRLPNTFATPTFSVEDRTNINGLELRLEQLQNTYKLYQQIYTNLMVLGNASDQNDSNLEQQQLQSTLALYQQIRSSLISSYENIRLSRLNSTSNIVSVEPALPGRPLGPNVLYNTGLAAAIGLMLAAGIIFLVEYLDDTIKSSEQVTQTLDLPVIGYIGEMQNQGDSVYVSENPRSPISEAFRTLRTNLEFASVDKPIKTLLIVSVQPAEGKSTTAVNLAITLAQGGKKVLLIDADLRRPRIHRYLGMPNRVGLSDLFRDRVPLEDVMRPWKDTSLLVVTSGGVPPNPADLLASHRMADILKSASALVDIVVVDAPPFLVADASILASRVDGVLLVMRPGKTPMDGAVSTLEQLKRAGANLLGVSMNRIPRNRPNYYGGYRYYSGYYKGEYLYYDDSRTGKGRSNGKSARWFWPFGSKKQPAKEAVPVEDHRKAQGQD